MTDHPTPGSPLSADDVGLLKDGDAVRHASKGVMRFSCVGGDGALICSINSWASWIDAPDAFTFIGRPDADGWIVWHGMGFAEWMRGLTVVAKTHRGHVRAPSRAENVAWQNMVAFRLPTDRRAEADTDENDCGCADRAPLDRYWKCPDCDAEWHPASPDTPPSAGSAAGLETVTDLLKWVAEGNWQGVGYTARMSQAHTALGQVASAAAALEAAAKREGEADRQARIIMESARDLKDRATRAEAQVADRDKRIAELEAALRTARETLDAFDCALTTDRPVAGAARKAVRRIDQAMSAIPTPGRV